MASALDILDELLVGYTALHRRFDAWDLLDGNRVVAVICVRKASGFVTISLPAEAIPQKPRPGGPIVMPYAEEVVVHITADGSPPRGARKKDTVVLSTYQARDLLARLVCEPMSRTEGAALAASIAAA